MAFGESADWYRNISASGFSFDDRFPLERPGDPILMEFPLPGSRDRDRRESVPLAWRSNVKTGGTFLVRAVSLDKGVSSATNAEVVQITDLALSWKVAKPPL